MKSLLMWPVIALALALSACSQSPLPAATASTQTPAQPSTAVPAEAATIEVWKSPTCGCCSKWVEHLQGAGFKVVTHDENAMNPLKAKLGVPQNLASCHTATVGGYVIEGHVPAEDIRKLLAEKPAARGLAVPGMPIGSPGMEQGDRHDAYETVLFSADGSTRTFAEHGN